MEGMENAVNNIPLEVVVDILQYVTPSKLHDIAEQSKHSREVVNRMSRGRYMDMWLCSKYLTENIEYNIGVHGISMEYELENYWYFRLTLSNDTYPRMVELMDKIGDRRLSLDLSRTDIDDEDIDKLAGVYILDLTLCKNITDKGLATGALANVRYLNISNNERITHRSLNAGAVANVHNLDISTCNNIIDLSALVNIHTLIVSNYIHTLDFSMLRGLHILELTDTTISNMEYLHDLRDVYDLRLLHYNVDLDVSGLTNVHKLIINYCNNINNKNKLVNLSELNIFDSDYRDDVKDLYGLGNLDSLRAIWFGPQKCNTANLGYIKNLDIN